MAKRRTEFRPDSGGQYFRQIGWKLSSKGKLTQPKFRLGRERALAEIGYHKLGLLWETVEREWQQRHGRSNGTFNSPASKPTEGRPLWGEWSLQIAEAIRQHQHVVRVLPPNDFCGEVGYATHLDYLRQQYGHIISFEPADTEQFGQGQQLHRQTAEHRVRQARLNARIADAPVSGVGDDMLHEAIEAYADWALENKSPGMAAAEADHARRLKKSLQDIPLASLDYNVLERMKQYWANRPPSERPGAKGKPIAISTVKNQVKLLRRFVKWLHRNPDYDWRRPEDADEALALRIQPLLTEEEISAQARGPACWSVEELTTLYRYATDRERFLILMGLNLGFAQSELISFRHDDLGRAAEATVRRTRRKTHKLFEAGLWPETVTALDWLAAEQQGQVPKGSLYVFMTVKGTRPSSQDIANRWNALLTRVRDDQPGFRRLSFKFLRKTAFKLVRDVSDYETAALFQARAKVSSDSYADAYAPRTFSKVREANAEVRKLLDPMFAAAPEAFSTARKRGGANISQAKIEQIQQLWREGEKPNAIASAVGVSRATVYRWRPAMESPPRGDAA
ncbi:MAG: helix-turn-helix domain-containing protein [Phycisphaerae bacterium]